MHSPNADVPCHFFELRRWLLWRMKALGLLQVLSRDIRSAHRRTRTAAAAGAQRPAGPAGGGPAGEGGAAVAGHRDRADRSGAEESSSGSGCGNARAGSDGELGEAALAEERAESRQAVQHAREGGICQPCADACAPGPGPEQGSRQGIPWGSGPGFHSDGETDGRLAPPSAQNLHVTLLDVEVTYNIGLNGVVHVCSARCAASALAGTCKPHY